MSKNEYGQAKSGALREKMDTLPYDLIPFQEFANAFARVAEHGAQKYAPWNWSKGLPRVQVIGSLLRHTFAYLRGEERDKDSGLLHTDHILWNATVLSHGVEHGLEDGRRGEPERDYREKAMDLETRTETDFRAFGPREQQAMMAHGDDVFQVNLGSVAQDDEALIGRVLEEVNKPEDSSFHAIFESLFGSLPDGYVVEGRRVGDIEILHIGPGSNVEGSAGMFDDPMAFATFAGGGEWNAGDEDLLDDEILKVALSTDIHAYAAHLEDPTYTPYDKLDVLGDDDPTQILQVDYEHEEYDRAHIVEGLTQKQFDNLSSHEAAVMVARGNQSLCKVGERLFIDKANPAMGVDRVEQMLERRVLLGIKAQPLRQVRLDFPMGGSSERSTRLTNDQLFVAAPGVRVTEMHGARVFA